MTREKASCGIVSVLIPLYNHELTIERALGSLLNSDHKNIELIISDDCSRDGSFLIAKRWVENNGHLFYDSKVIQQNKNLGITQNINALLSYVTGEFVTLLASDDELPICAIDIQKKYLEKNLDKDFVFSNISLIDKDGKIVSEKIVSKRRAFFLSNSRCISLDVLYNWSLPWARLFGKTEALLKFGPYPQYRAEDLWSALMILKSGRYGYLDEVVHHFRVKSVGTATGGFDPNILWEDMLKLQISFSKNSSNFLGLILNIRARSFGFNQKNLLSRLPWIILRKGIENIHKLLIGN